jgi:hypothetical protein
MIAWRSDSLLEERVMQERTLVWGLLIASLTNAICVCGYLGGCWLFGAG